MKLHLVDETIELLIEKKIDKTNNKKKNWENEILKGPNQVKPN